MNVLDEKSSSTIENVVLSTRYPQFSPPPPSLAGGLGMKRGRGEPRLRVYQCNQNKLRILRQSKY